MGRHAAAAVALAILAPAPVAGQDFFPGFETAAEADAIYLTGVVLSHVVDDTCTFGPDVLTEAAGRALAENEIDVLLVPEAPEKGVVLDVSALVLPVLGTDSCAVATGLQLTIERGDEVLLAAENFNLIAWTVTGFVQRLPDIGREGRCYHRQRTTAGAGRLKPFRRAAQSPAPRRGSAGPLVRARGMTGTAKA